MKKTKKNKIKELNRLFNIMSMMDCIWKGLVSLNEELEKEQDEIRKSYLVEEIQYCEQVHMYLGELIDKWT